MIDVVGGTYEETCRFPNWHQFFGSGGRAAAAIASLGGLTRLHTFGASGQEARRKALGDAFGFEVAVTSGAPEVSFDYFHALSPVQFVASFEPLHDPSRRIQVTSDATLRFGMLEGEGIVHAKRCVYDPQSPVAPEAFGINGSSADELAVVCNIGEAQQLTGRTDPRACAMALAERASLAIVKAGAAGAFVASKESCTTVPSYRTASVFPIGSGDVFSAVFAKAWMQDGARPVDAAQMASRATALYCSSMTLPSLERLVDEGSQLVPFQTKSNFSRRPMVYLAAPFFTMSQCWLLDEARAELSDAGLDVFSPFHDVGMGRSAFETAKLDLEGLQRADAVFALLDGMDAGTLFEVGFATKSGTPVVCYVSEESSPDLTMLIGSGALATSDFATAVYAAAWAALASP